MSHLASLVTVLLITACSTQPPAPPMPDGRQRQVVNTPERIAAFKRNQPAGSIGATAKATAASVQPHGGHLCADAAFDVPPEDSATCPASHHQSPGPLVNMHEATITLPDNELLELRPRSLLVSVPCRFGTADCTPSSRLAAVLLRAAHASPRIEIRGRTDAIRATPADVKLAWRRARDVQQQLIRQGIPSTRMHTSALAAGGHIADNTTEAGKSRNRRVEIEIMDIDPGSYGTIARGEQHEPDRRTQNPSKH